MNDTMNKPLLRVKQDPVTRTVDIEFRRDTDPRKRLTEAQLSQAAAETASQVERLTLTPGEREEVQALVESTLRSLATGGIAQAGARSLAAALQSMAEQLNGLGKGFESLARSQEEGGNILMVGHASGMIAGASAMLATSADLLLKLAEDDTDRPTDAQEARA
jgi:hypothetical protein